MPCVGQSVGSPEHHLPLVMDQARVSPFVSGCGTRSKGQPEPQFPQMEKGSSPGRNPQGDAKGGLGLQGGKQGSAGSPLQLHRAASLRIPAGAGSGTPGQSRGGTGAAAAEQGGWAAEPAAARSGPYTFKSLLTLAR